MLCPIKMHNIFFINRIIKGLFIFISLHTLTVGLKIGLSKCFAGHYKPSVLLGFYFFNTTGLDNEWLWATASLLRGSREAEPIQYRSCPLPCRLASREAQFSAGRTLNVLRFLRYGNDTWWRRENILAISPHSGMRMQMSGFVSVSAVQWLKNLTNAQRH